jgi:magnesium-transporting ATPase (P-type)
VGDILVLSTGDIIVADGLVFERNTLKIFEGALTGESNAISKGVFEFKERGTFQVPADVDLQQMNVPGSTPQERAAKYEPTPSRTPLVFKGTPHSRPACESSSAFKSHALRNRFLAATNNNHAAWSS